MIGVCFLEDFHGVVRFRPLIKFLKVPVHVFFLSYGIEGMDLTVKFVWGFWL